MAVNPVVADAVQESNPVAGSILAEPPTPVSAASTPSTSTPSGVEGGATVAPEGASPESTESNIESTPEEKAQGKVNMDKFPAAAKKDFNNPDLPLAKAAMWNAFFTGLSKGGVSDAIAEAGNAYGRSLTKFADKEAEYLSQRRIINQQAQDNIKDTLDNFDSGDEYTNSIVKNYGDNPEMLTKLSEDLANRGELETAEKVKAVISDIKKINDTRRDSLMSTANSLTGGGIQKAEATKGYATIDGQQVYVTGSQVIGKNGRVTNTYSYTDPRTGKKVTTDSAPDGYQAVTTFNAQQSVGNQVDVAFQKSTGPKIEQDASSSRGKLPLIADTEDVLKRKPQLFGKLIVDGAVSAVGQKVIRQLAGGEISQDEAAQALGISKEDLPDYQKAMFAWNNLSAASTKDLLGGAGIGTITDFERQIAKETFGDINKMTPEQIQRVINWQRFKTNLAQEKRDAYNEYLRATPAGSRTGPGFDAYWDNRSKDLFDQWKKSNGVESAATAKENAAGSKNTNIKVEQGGLDAALKKRGL